MRFRIRFILELNFSSGTQRSKLLSLYGDKFLSLVGEARSKKYFRLDYEALPKIRIFLKRFHGLNEIIPELRNEMCEDNIMKILEVAPLFDVSPICLQAYLLLSLGFRGLGVK